MVGTEPAPAVTTLTAVPVRGFILVVRFSLVTFSCLTQPESLQTGEGDSYLASQAPGLGDVSGVHGDGLVTWPRSAAGEHDPRQSCCCPLLTRQAGLRAGRGRAVVVWRLSRCWPLSLMTLICGGCAMAPSAVWAGSGLTLGKGALGPHGGHAVTASQVCSVLTHTCAH